MGRGYRGTLSFAILKLPLTMITTPPTELWTKIFAQVGATVESKDLLVKLKE